MRDVVDVFTVGHGTADEAALLQRLRATAVGEVVDVRRYPGSRRHPAMERSLMASWLPSSGIAYRWEPRLGGRRRDPPDSPDTGLRVRAFAGYAAHLRTEEAACALADLVAEALTALAEDPELRFRLGATAQAIVRDRHVPGPNAAILAKLIAG